MRNALTRPTIILALALSLTACGGGTNDANASADGASDTQASTASDDVDPCSFVTTDEVAAITTDAVSGTTREDNSCTYNSKPDGGVRVVVMTSGGKQQMETQHRAADLLGGMGTAAAKTGNVAAQDAGAMMQKDTRATPTIGDEATWGMNAMLAVRKGDRYLEVWPPIIHDPATHKGYPLLSDQEKRAVSEAIARKVLAKLAN